MRMRKCLDHTPLLCDPFPDSAPCLQAKQRSQKTTDTSSEHRAYIPPVPSDLLKQQTQNGLFSQFLSQFFHVSFEASSICLSNPVRTEYRTILEDIWSPCFLMDAWEWRSLLQHTTLKSHMPVEKSVIRGLRVMLERTQLHMLFTSTVMPQPWDHGDNKILEQLNYRAVGS